MGFKHKEKKFYSIPISRGKGLATKKHNKPELELHLKFTGGHQLLPKQSAAPLKNEP